MAGEWCLTGLPKKELTQEEADEASTHRFLIDFINSYLQPKTTEQPTKTNYGPSEPPVRLVSNSNSNKTSNNWLSFTAAYAWIAQWRLSRAGIGNFFSSIIRWVNSFSYFKPGGNKALT